jgi:hypothetical protein
VILCEIAVGILIPTEACTELLFVAVVTDFYLVSIETNDKPTNNDLFRVMMYG